MTAVEYERAYGVSEAKVLSDGRIAFLMQLMFTWALCVGRPQDQGCYDDRWCYHTHGAASHALHEWDGTGEPTGWHRHPFSGRRRPDGDPAEEYVNL